MVKKSKSNSPQHSHYIAIVAIVTVVAVVILVMNSMKTPVEETGEDQALVGQAYGSTIIDKNEFFDKYGDYADKDLTFTKEGTKYCFQPHLRSYFKLPPRITKIIPRTPPRKEANGYEWYLECNAATGEYCDCNDDDDCENYYSANYCVVKDVDHPEIGKMCAPYCLESCYEGDINSEGDELTCREPTESPYYGGSDQTFICAPKIN